MRGKLGRGPNVGYEVNTMLESRICSNPVLLPSWWVYIKQVNIDTNDYLGKPRTSTQSQYVLNSLVFCSL
jgi:hypothetical protein